MDEPVRSREQPGQETADAPRVLEGSRTIVALEAGHQAQAAVRGCLLSVGHSNHPLDKLLDLLKTHRVEVLVDIRSLPRSSYSPHFDQAPLRQAVKGARIRYLFLGKELGGRPDGEEYYDPEGYVLYGRFAESPLFLKGIDRVLEGVKRFRIALLCSEEDPEACHRRLLVGRVLAQRGFPLTHIRGDGRLQTEAELEADVIRRRTRGQPTLFGAVAEDKEREWKSVRSVSPSGRQRTSSGPSAKQA